MSFNTISEWLSLNSNLLLGATWETLYMVAVAGIVGFAVGIPLGVILHTTKKGGLLENTKLNRVLGAIVNIGRSVPFLVLMVAIIPVTKLLVGTFIGTTAAIVPLTIGAIPFVARLIEGALLEVPSGLVGTASLSSQPPDLPRTRASGAHRAERLNQPRQGQHKDSATIPQLKK